MPSCGGDDAISTMNSKRRTISRGFTIVELVVVIAVIALLATLSVVGYSAWQRDIAKDVLEADLTAATAQLKSDLNWNNTYPENVLRRTDR